MHPIQERLKKEGGQVFILTIFVLLLASTLLMGLFKISLAVKQKIRLQISADMAVISALNCQANGLNSIAVANRAVLANDALAGQLNAIVSETTFYRKLAEKFEKLLRFIPYAGPISKYISCGINIMERTARKAAVITLPLLRLSNSTLRKGQESILHLLPLYSLRSIESTLDNNLPEAELTNLSKTLAYHQVHTLKKSITTTSPEDTIRLKMMTMDRHTIKRDWRIKIGGLSPVKKSGGTNIAADDLVSQDKLRVKVFRRFRWRWKTAISSTSRTADFRYRTPCDFLSLDLTDYPGFSSITLLVRTELPSPLEDPFQERELLALASGSLTYTRKSKADEAPNLFNPFWKAQLIPVAAEHNAKRLVPDVMLKEVLH